MQLLPHGGRCSLASSHSGTRIPSHIVLRTLRPNSGTYRKIPYGAPRRAKPLFNVPGIILPLSRAKINPKLISLGKRLLLAWKIPLQRSDLSGLPGRQPVPYMRGCQGLCGRLYFFSPQACEKIVRFLNVPAGSVLPRVLAALSDARRAEFSRQAGECFQQERLETTDF